MTSMNTSLARRRSRSKSPQDPNTAVQRQSAATSMHAESIRANRKRSRSIIDESSNLPSGKKIRTDKSPGREGSAGVEATEAVFDGEKDGKKSNHNIYGLSKSSTAVERWLEGVENDTLLAINGRDNGFGAGQSTLQPPASPQSAPNHNDAVDCEDVVNIHDIPLVGEGIYIKEEPNDDEEDLRYTTSTPKIKVEPKEEFEATTNAPRNPSNLPDEEYFALPEDEQWSLMIEAKFREIDEQEAEQKRIKEEEDNISTAELERRLGITNAGSYNYLVENLGEQDREWRFGQGNRVRKPKPGKRRKTPRPRGEKKRPSTLANDSRRLGLTLSVTGVNPPRYQGTAGQAERRRDAAKEAREEAERRKKIFLEKQKEERKEPDALLKKIKEHSEAQMSEEDRTVAERLLEQESRRLLKESIAKANPRGDKVVISGPSPRTINESEKRSAEAVQRRKDAVKAERERAAALKQIQEKQRKARRMAEIQERREKGRKARTVEQDMDDELFG